MLCAKHKEQKLECLARMESMGPMQIIVLPHLLFVALRCRGDEIGECAWQSVCLVELRRKGT